MMAIGGCGALSLKSLEARADLRGAKHPDRVRLSGAPTTRFRCSFRDLYESFLNELRRSRHGIRVDLDSGKQVCVSPLVNFRGRAAQLNLHTAFHLVSDELFVGIAGRHVAFGLGWGAAGQGSAADGVPVASRT